VLGGAGLIASCTRAGSDPSVAVSTSPRGPGAAPTNDVLVVRGKMVLRNSRSVAGVVIEPGGELTFHPGRDVTLRSTGNVVVRGRLTMRPRDARTLHRIIFTGVNESEFVGGGMDVLDSDVGLWVMGRGALDIAGSRRRAWTRATGSIGAGDTTIDLEHDPVGWRAGDEIAIAPTGQPSNGHETQFDVIPVASVSGRTVRLRRGTSFAHPAVPTATGPTLTAEVMNLTRNVRIEGTPGGRSHVFVRSARRQRVAHAAMRHVAPGVLGRYGLHFHHAEDGTRRSVVDSVVVRDAGGHAFVPHWSHGITFRSCISYDTQDVAYWWDLPDATHDALYQDCVAAIVRPVQGDGGQRLSAFSMNRGDGNVARGCVAVGVQGSKSASGYHWPEDSEPDGTGVWTFVDNVAHNNRVNGIFTWQNDESRHVIDRFTAYRNGGFGIEHGAYFNRYQYKNSLLVGNGGGGVLNHARSVAGTTPVLFERIVVEDSPVGFLEGAINDNALQNPPAIVCGPTFRNVGRDVDDGEESSPTFDVRTNC
jgi:hypothetical protein